MNALHRTYFGYFLLLAGLLALSACGSTYYLEKGFADLASDHEKIAILPFRIELSAERPASLTKDEWQKEREAESLAFQQVYYDEVTTMVETGKYVLWVEIQPLEETRKRLEDRGIAVSQSWALAPADLAAALEVDAVISGWVEKNRVMYFPGEFGLPVDPAIEGKLKSHRGEAPSYSIKGRTVEVAVQLLDGRDSRKLWAAEYDQTVTWGPPPRKMMETILKPATQKIPYQGARD